MMETSAVMSAVRLWDTYLTRNRLPKRRMGTGHVHHIVAQGDRRAAEARGILASASPDSVPVHSIPNLVWLPKGYHGSIHTNPYYAGVNQALRGKSSTTSVVTTLNVLKAAILFRTFDRMRANGWRVGKDK